MMKFTPFYIYSDNNYISLRDRRASIVAYVCSVLVILLIVNWILIGFLTHTPALIFFQLTMLLFIITGIRFIYQKKLPLGFSLLLISIYIYIMSVSILFEGMGHEIHNKTVYYVVPLLAITQYFAAYLSRKFVIFFSLVCFVSLILYQLSIVEFPPLILLSNMDELDKISQLMVPVTVVIIILILSLLAVDNVTSATNSYNNANDTLNMIMESMLPKDVAYRLQAEGKTFADSIKDCTILFVKIDIPIESESLSNENEINILRHIFEDFEEETEQAGLEKIKTIGSSFMIASGVPQSRSDHCEAAVKLAFKLRDIASEYALQLRIGINSGAAIAGVIGKTKFVYDLWGDTVNVASRLESQGVLGKIQISSTTAEQLDEKTFKLESRGKIFLKGRGYISSYFVED